MKLVLTNQLLSNLLLFSRAYRPVWFCLVSRRLSLIARKMGAHGRKGRRKEEDPGPWWSLVLRARYQSLAFSARLVRNKSPKRLRRDRVWIVLKFWLCEMCFLYNQDFEWTCKSEIIVIYICSQSTHDDQQFKELIEQAFRRWDADKIGLPDYALQSTG